MKLIKLFFITLLLSACASNAPKQQSDTVSSTSASKDLIIKTVVFSNPDEVRDAVKNECNLKEKLTSYIKKNIDGQYNIVENSMNAAVLEIEISEAHGNSGGAWSGSKMVMIKGELKRGGQLISSFKAKRFSGGGMFAGFKGTCAILGRCVRTLGKDVAKWLENPTKNARLGDL
ncbi:MAG: hypothetical protein GQ569_06380 [Methylococcaceae bacterium]|nr:hypothetical protein [Methylococcaceae bacterium]